MEYISTRDPKVRVESAQAIVQGISSEGGLFCPQEIPQLTQEEWQELLKMDYVQRAVLILSKFLTDFSSDELQACVQQAYTPQKFETNSPIQLSQLEEDFFLLELWHGPTCAFKDMALQLLPHLLTQAVQKTQNHKEMVILVATSGDTGKAALEGFRDVEGTRIQIFYPQNGVSAIQEKQMVTQEGDNVSVCAVQGNFDDAQTAVKQIFTDAELQQTLAQKGKMFSSANSINWGRLVPQVVYYISAYCDLLQNGKIQREEKLHIAVPTGNFGNILAAYIAKEMGLPVDKLICASNQNDVLTEFIHTGVYNRNRPFYVTISPSMDILVSSNLERLLYLLSGQNEEISQYMAQLATEGSYQISADLQTAIGRQFIAGYTTEEATRRTIQKLFQNYSYLCDPHTAVAVHVCEEYRKQTEDSTKILVASTASAYKFAPDVLKALDASATEEGFDALEHLEKLSNIPAPKALKDLKDKKERFSNVCNRESMRKAVLDAIL